MSIYLGNTKIGQMYLGSSKIAQAYIGSTKVWDKGGVPVPSRLPAGYTEVEYLVNTGSSGIMRIDFYNNPKYSIHAKFGQDTINRGFICGTNTNNCPYFYSYYDSTHAHDTFNINVSKNGTSIGSKTIYSPLDTNIHTVDYIGGESSQSYLHNGVQVSATTYDLSSASNDTLPYALFARNHGSGSSYSYKGRIYEFWIADGDTKLVELVPCVQDSDSQAGMYDIVRERFITGGSAITAGPAIN